LPGLQSLYEYRSGTRPDQPQFKGRGIGNVDYSQVWVHKRATIVNSENYRTLIIKVGDLNVAW
jgi:hypothetical protein